MTLRFAVWAGLASAAVLALGCEPRCNGADQLCRQPTLDGGCEVYSAFCCGGETQAHCGSSGVIVGDAGSCPPSLQPGYCL